jgi:glyoxylase-like metal-dependent hydrolase (beta-lactamase superfamily II)
MIRVESAGDLTFLRLARTLAGRPVYWTGAWLAGEVLIDCGPPATAHELLDALEGRRIEALVLTHHHEDHVGAAPLLAQRRGLAPLASAPALPLLEHGFEQQVYRRLTWGRPGRFQARALPAVLEVGRFRLRPVPTPGHSPDHVCFLDERRGFLFTGDLYLAEKLRFLRSDEDVSLLVASLEAAGRLGAERVLCAHRGEVEDGSAALLRKADHLRSLRERILDLLAQGLPEAEVTRRAVGREGLLTWVSQGHFSARNFVRAVAARLTP